MVKTNWKLTVNDNTTGILAINQLIYNLVEEMNDSDEILANSV